MRPYWICLGNPSRVADPATGRSQTQQGRGLEKWTRIWIHREEQLSLKINLIYVDNLALQRISTRSILAIRNSNTIDSHDTNESINELKSSCTSCPSMFIHVVLKIMHRCLTPLTEAFSKLFRCRISEYLYLIAGATDCRPGKAGGTASEGVSCF